MESAVSQTQYNADTSILGRVATNDKQAVEDCMNKYGNLVWSIALSFLHSRTEAEDAVQDIFIDIWKYAGRFDAEKSGESHFVSMIARRRLIDRLRKSNRQPKTFFLEGNSHDCYGDGDTKLQNYIEAKEAVRHLIILKPLQRQIIQMAFYDGMSQTEIAETIGLPLGTVKSHIRRGFQKIRTSLSVETDTSSVLLAN